MYLLTRNDLAEQFAGKRVVVVGSAPSCLHNTKEEIEDYDEIVRVNNYKTKGYDKRGRWYDYTEKVGERTDYHFSFYGGSIRKTQEDLKGIKAHLCKCPNDECHVTSWHIRNRQKQGGDFRPLYRRREGFWIAPVYIPNLDDYLKLFDRLGRHVPSTGLYAIYELMLARPKELYITGFDFMTSILHNVDERWLKGRQDDPIKHDWEGEKIQIRKWILNHDFMKPDRRLIETLGLYKTNGV